LNNFANTRNLDNQSSLNFLSSNQVQQPQQASDPAGQQKAGHEVQGQNYYAGKGQQVRAVNPQKGFNQAAAAQNEQEDNNLSKSFRRKPNSASS